ncbi:MAG: superoxide dismutase family protein [Rhodothermales bacterium]
MPLRPLLLLAALSFAACADRPDADTPDPTTSLDTTSTPMSMDGGRAAADAVATLSPTEGNDVRGRVTFADTPDGVRIVAEISGLSEGMHGFHVHETGDCSAPDATSAGGHFNPDDTPHGAPEAPAPERHDGDLGNLEAGADGIARYERIDPNVALSGPASVIGKAVIVHAGQDDFTSQPSGDAGGRVACGVIETIAG